MSCRISSSDQGWKASDREYETEKQLPKLSSKKTPEKNHFSNCLLKEESPRKVGWGSGRWNTTGYQSWLVSTYESQLLNFPECRESVFKFSHLLKIKLIYNKINYIKNKGNNVQNSLPPILLHLIVIYALEVIYIYCFSNYIMEILYNGMLLFISAQLCVQRGDVYCLKSVVVGGLSLR